MKKWIVSIVVVLAVSAVAIWSVSRLLSVSRAEKPQPLMQAGAGESGSVRPIDDLQTRLLDPRVDLQSREMLMEKIELEKRADKNRQAGAAQPAPKTAPQNLVAPAAMIPQEQVESGIFEGSEGMIRSEQAEIQNHWAGVVDGNIVMVFAGAKTGQKEQGMLVVVTASLDPNVNDTVFEYYYAPANSGILRVLEAHEGYLVLQRANGAPLKFDLMAKKFIQ